MAWRVAYSLNRLLDQFNALAPTRNKASDGSIGDTSHQNRKSDHNPWYPPPAGGIVTARDFTHDPAKLSMHWVADTLITHRDPRIKYIIWNRRIWTPGQGWRAYSGANPHTSHLHLSVVDSPACDSTAAWAGFIPQPPEVPEVETTTSLAAHTWNGQPIPQAENVGNALTNTFNYAKNAEAAALRTEAKVAALTGTVTNNQAAVMAAIEDNGAQVDLSTEQMQALIAGLTVASKQGLRELLGSLDNE